MSNSFVYFIMLCIFKFILFVYIYAGPAGVFAGPREKLLMVPQNIFKKYLLFEKSYIYRHPEILNFFHI